MPDSTTDLAARLARLEQRLALVEDKLAITELMTTYGPAVDSGSAEAVARLWTEDGVYDVDTGVMRGHAEIIAMVRSAAHQRWIGDGCGHVLEPGHLLVDGDTAVATCKSQLITHDDGHFTVRRVTATRWHLRKIDGVWKVTLRIGRLLDGRPEARALLARADRM
jgi:uncharacterized protein (TIGR02246 family)